MKSIDKFLIGIVIGIIILVGVAFAVALMRPEPTYQEENTPEAVAYDYLMALQRKEYDRAYGFLSPSLASYPPSVEQFIDDLNDHSWQFRQLEEGSTAFKIESTQSSGQWMMVSVEETHFQSRGLFDSNQYSTSFDLSLQQENGTWKLVDGDSYWLDCWENERGCR